MYKEISVGEGFQPSLIKKHIDMNQQGMDLDLLGPLFEGAVSKADWGSVEGQTLTVLFQDTPSTALRSPTR